MADRPLREAHSEFVRYKTTHRAHYDAFTPRDPAVFDTLLWNEAGELTECTRGNIALHLDGRWVTPALHWSPRPRLTHPDPGFVTHLIATADHAPQTRSLRRGSLADDFVKELHATE